MNYNTLLWGEPDDVSEALNHECDEGELRAALQNAFRRIAALEVALAAQQGEKE